MMRFETLFEGQKPIVGMVHLLPLPDGPAYGGDIAAIYARAEADADALNRAGVHALIVENFGDEPYFIGEPTPTQLAVMAGVTQMVRAHIKVPVGVNVQFNAWQAEVAIAYACRAQFMRVEVFVDTVLMAQGTVQPCSAQITRLRHSLGADKVQIWADVQTKYTQNIIPQAIAQSAKDAANAGADALIVTGSATGQATPLDAVEEVKAAVKLPVLVGSGANANTIADILQVGDGAIVGSSLKVDGIATNAVSYERTSALMEVVRAL